MKSQHELIATLEGIDPEEVADRLLRDLKTSRTGLPEREAQRRVVQHGPNELQRSAGRQWPRELGRQLTHPLALLLWLAAGLSLGIGSAAVAGAVLLVIALNAGFAFVQELQAERAVEALAHYLPAHATVLRDGVRRVVDAAELVPGDVVAVDEGERIPADLRLLSGAIEVDMSALSGESVPTIRSATLSDTHVPLLAARDLVFSGTSCVGGQAIGVVFATGMRTEIGRIAALSQRVEPKPSPLENQVRRVAWIIAGVAAAMAAAFVPIAMLGAHLSLHNAVVFAVGLLAGNVPEGLLPVITLALAVAVRSLAARGAVVKRLSSVETLGSTDVICTDKTGTLTENRMSVTDMWTVSGPIDPAAGVQAPGPARIVAETAAACNNAGYDESGQAFGDPTEIALLDAAAGLGEDVSVARRETHRRWQFHFDPERKLMSTVDDGEGLLVVHTKGAPEAVLPLCDSAWDQTGERPLTDADRALIGAQVDYFAGSGLRVLALATRRLPSTARAPRDRHDAEQGLCFAGLVAMLDPPRQGVAEAVAHCHAAGIRIVVITGDHGRTAAAIAEKVGITSGEPVVVNGEDLDVLDDAGLDGLLSDSGDLIFARSSPEAKLRIAEALQAQGHVVAMTGDGVNDAPALHRADIGVAMGRSGTDVAREASTMVLTDDNFATIVAAIHDGRRVYDNVRKFIVYIFAHATPEVVPFLVFALAGGAVPLPLTVLQILAFDVGSETLPALALGRERAEPGIMERPPRPRGEGVIRGPMLIRAWLFLGVLVAALEMAGFFYVLTSAGWHPGDPTGVGTSLHLTYLQATTMSFIGMIAGQIGTAFAARTQHASLRSIGIVSNRHLLVAIAGELVFAAVTIYAPPLQSLLGTAALPPRDLLLMAPYPFVVWGADELRRYAIRRRARRG